ncbi:MAG: hypothetical protein RLZZ450_85 [Pseudomonadota bacterium]
MSLSDNPGTVLAYTDPNTGLFSVVDFDILTGEEHTISAAVSSHPVEEGANISDHVRPELQRLTLRVRVTDSPINRVTLTGTSPAPLAGFYGTIPIVGKTSRQLSYANVSGGYPPLTLPNGIPLIGGLSAPTLGGTRPFVAPIAIPGERGEDFVTLQANVLKLPPLQRVRKVFEIFEVLCRTGVPCEVHSELRYYPRMLISQVGAPRDGTNSVEFSLSLQELRTAKTQKVFVQLKQPKPAQKRAEKEAAQGKQAEPFKFDDKASLGVQLQRTKARGTPSLTGG